ncbi:MAG: SAV_6107 family HEPN domain-containing protein [Gordonia sp. (in: high G+C Gram-positive bacteria)]
MSRQVPIREFGSGSARARRASPRSEVDPVVVTRSRDLFERAEVVFANADGVTDDPERFRQYYLAALRAAGAALAVHEPPVRGGARRVSANAWARISSTVPELTHFAQRFSDLSRTRMEIESGISRTIDPATVDGLRADVDTFLDAVERLLIAYEQGSLAHQALGAIGHSA